MLWPQRQCPKNKQVQRALRKIDAFVHHVLPHLLLQEATPSPVEVQGYPWPSHATPILLYLKLCARIACRVLWTSVESSLLGSEYSLMEPGWVDVADGGDALVRWV
jgi:hypothetical protein